MKGISEYQRYEFVVAPPFEFGLGFSGFSSPTTFLNVDDISSEPFCFIDLLMQVILFGTKGRVYY